MQIRGGRQGYTSTVVRKRSTENKRMIEKLLSYTGTATFVRMLSEV